MTQNKSMAGNPNLLVDRHKGGILSAQNAHYRWEKTSNLENVILSIEDTLHFR